MMFYRRKIETITDLLWMDRSAWGNWQYRNFKGSNGLGIKMINQSQTDFAVIRQDISKEEKSELSWNITDKSFKKCLSGFEGSMFIDLHCKSCTNTVFSFICKFASGQIVFSAGNLYFRQIEDIVDLAVKFKKIEHLFPV